MFNDVVLIDDRLWRVLYCVVVLCCVVFVDIVLTTYIVEFVVEATGIANRVTIAVTSPQRGRRGLAVCTAGSGSSRRWLWEIQQWPKG